MADTPEALENRGQLARAVVRFAGDSGDGMQLTGSQFANEVAWAGNDLATLPNFPAEIRAPAGTLFGVSSFQIQFGSQSVYTPGDTVDCLVTMNPAAFKVHLPDLKPNGILLVNSYEFNKKNLLRAGFESNPLEADPNLRDRYRVLDMDVTELTRGAVKPVGLSFKDADRCKNFFCLGVISFLYNRPIDVTVDWLKVKFKKRPQIYEANVLALKAGHAFAETMEWQGQVYDVEPASLPAGTYRQITGNRAIALGLVAASTRANRPLVYGAYPITPASDILHELAVFKNYRVRTLQAEDEIAACCATIGAAFGGAIAVTGTSGPGVALKGEAMGLAVSVELPIVVINVQRGGPSTGLPTKTEQSDLLQGMFGRNGECPMIVLAPATPGECFDMGYEAVRLATKYMTPVLVLSDGYLANGAEPWRVPDVSSLPPVEVKYAAPRESADDPDFQPFTRDDNTLARPWAIPGTKGLEHRIG
ncbi:MAG: 2-oxoacid:acceptor oxidoreductase subunit alpha, partial [Planctomycetota bacterium]